MSEAGLSLDRLTRVLRFARRLALERDPDGARAALVQFTLEVITGDGAAVVVREPSGELAVVEHFGAAFGEFDAAVMQAAGQTIGSGRTAFLQPDLARRAARPELGRIAAAPLRLGAQRAALVLTRLHTAAELHEVCLEPLWLIASLASEVLRRTEAERAAQALEHHVDAWAAASDAAVILLDREQRVVRLDERAGRLLGGKPPGLQGKLLAEIDRAGPLCGLLSGSESERRHATVVLAGTARTVRVRPHLFGSVLLLTETAVVEPSAHRARYAFEDILTQDPTVLSSLDAARQTAQSSVSILITGESGTGKEVLAQAIHSASPRSEAPFVAVNVAAIPSELLESELFGYETGAFTGARERGKPGAFELAGQGTLLLDEVGEMPSEMQAKLLRVLQERQVQRLGGTVPIPVAARVLATTNRDLEERVKAGRFRLDLFYRLRVVSIEMPPLRKRAIDIPLLAEHFLKQSAQTLGRSPVEISAAVLDQLVHHRWPGNIRELSNLLLGVVSLLPDSVRVIEELPVFLSRPDLTPIASPERIAAGPGSRWSPPAAKQPGPPQSLAELERAAIERTLSDTGGNMTETARILGISRTTLYKKVKDYGL